MLFHEEKNSSIYTVKSYQPGTLVINDLTYTKSLIICYNQLIPDWPPQTFNALTSKDLDILLQLKLELVLIGTGSKQHFPSAAILSPLIQANLGYEIMDTAAACRTFNLLATDGRKVAAALLIL